MPSKEIFQIDRRGDLKLSMEIRDGHLLIQKMVGDAVVPLNTKGTSNGDAILPMLSLKRPIRGAAGAITGYEEVAKITMPIPSELDISISPPDELEWWFDDKVMVGSVHLTPSQEISVQQKEIQRVIPSELRLAVNGALPVLRSDPTKDVDTIDKPITDLHTHYAGIMTADILISGIKEKQKMGKPIAYPVKYLLFAGIKIDDLKVYFDEAGFEAFKAAYEANPDKATFDITKMVTTEFEENPKNIENLSKLRDILHIPADKTIIFDEMEKYYEYRDILVKDKDLLAHFLKEIAKDYKKQGLEYVEISFSKITDPEWLKIVEEVVPEIEKDPGVQFRFLAIIARTAPKEKRESQIALFEKYASKSPYVLGMDLLAAEVNSTYDVLPELTALCEWAKTNYPGMVVRIHAGETSYHPENIAGVVELAKRYPNLNFRVGHGIYGVHADVIKEMQELKNIIPEVNMASNVALNMQGSIAHHTLFEYIASDIPVVLGSDGHGLYQSERLDLMKLLSYAEDVDIPAFSHRLAGVEKGHIAFVNRVFPERLHLFLKEFVQKARETGQLDAITSAFEAAHPGKLATILTNLGGETTEGLFITDAGEATEYSKDLASFYESIKTTPQYRAVWAKMYEGYPADKARLDAEDGVRARAYGEALAAQKQAVFDFCAAKEITVLHDTVKGGDSVLSDKTPLMITGVIPPGTSPEEEERITREVAAMVKTLLDTMDPSAFYFATTGVDIGVQKIVHKLVSEHNLAHPEKKFDLVGYVPPNVKPCELSAELSHVVMVDDIRNIYGMYEYIDKKMRAPERGLTMVCVGGNMWNKDVIQVASNVLKEKGASSDGQLLLYTGAGGAAKAKGRELPLQHSFTTIEAIIPTILGSSASEAAGIHDRFTAHLDASVDTAGLHGRATPCTSNEYAKKALPVVGGGRFGEEVTLESLEAYFSALMNKESTEGSVISTLMRANKELEVEITRLSKVFGLVGERPRIAEDPRLEDTHGTTKWAAFRSVEASLAAAGAAAGAAARHHDEFDPNIYVTMAPEDLEDLDLTAEQRSQIDKLIEERRASEVRSAPTVAGEAEELSPRDGGDSPVSGARTGGR